jgi:hypothetical protein
MASPSNSGISKNKIEYNIRGDKCTIAVRKQCSLDGIDNISEVVDEVRKVIPVARENFFQILKTHMLEGKGVNVEEAITDAVKTVYPDVTKEDIQKLNSSGIDLPMSGSIGGTRRKRGTKRTVRRRQSGGLGIMSLISIILIISGMKPAEANPQIDEAKRAIQDHVGRGLVKQSASVGVVAGALAGVAMAAACPPCGIAGVVAGAGGGGAISSLAVAKDLQKNFYANTPAKTKAEALGILDLDGNNGLPPELVNLFKHPGYDKPSGILGAKDADVIHAANNRIIVARDNGFQFVKNPNGNDFVVVKLDYSWMHAAAWGRYAGEVWANGLAGASAAKVLRPEAELLKLAKEQGKLGGGALGQSRYRKSMRKHRR